MTPEYASVIQLLQQADGSMQLKDLPNVTVETIEEQGTVTGRNWQSELGLPTYFDEWEVLAQAHSLTSRYIRFVLMDESRTRLRGNPRLQPQKVILPPTCQFELGHSSFVVGKVHTWILGFDEDRQRTPSMFGIEIPNDVEGDYIIGTAQLFDSGLADKAWQGLQQQIFTHVCPVVFRPLGEPPGTGFLIQVTLTPGDYPGCPGARVLKMWEV